MQLLQQQAITVLSNASVNEKEKKKKCKSSKNVLQIHLKDDCRR